MRYETCNAEPANQLMWNQKQESAMMEILGWLFIGTLCALIAAVLVLPLLVELKALIRRNGQKR